MSATVDMLCPLLVGIALGSAAYLACGGGTPDVKRGDASRLMEGLSHARTHHDQRGGLSKRRERVSRDMPAFLDIVTLGLAAGLSFDASLELYSARFDTELARLVTDALLSWRMGYRGRAEALEEMAREVDVPALHRFALTVSESLALGVPLSHTLSQQAEVLRDEQRADVEARIEQAPVKMLVPLGTLIVPAMLLAILGPLLGPALGL